MRHITRPLTVKTIDKFLTADSYDLDVTVDVPLNDIILSNGYDEFEELLRVLILNDDFDDCGHLTNLVIEVAGHSPPNTVRVRVQGKACIKRT